MAVAPTTTVRVAYWTPIRFFLLIIAVVLFLLAAFGLKSFGGVVDVVDLALACGFASLLPIP